MPSTESQSAVRALLQASAILLGRHDLPTILEEILNIAQKALAADAYALWRRIENTDRWHIDASRGLSSHFIADSSSAQGELTLEQGPMLLDDLHRDPRLEQRMEKLIAEGIAAMGVFPIHINQAASATLVFYYRSTHRFKPEELDYAGIVANLAGAAITNAELIRAQQVSAARLEILSRITDFFNSSLDFEQTANAVANSVVPHLADWCSLSIYEDGQLQNVAVAHQDPARIEIANELIRFYPERLDPQRGALKVMVSGESELITGITDEMIAAAARDARHLEILRALNIWSYIIVPLRVAGRSIGILRLVASRQRPDLSKADLQLAEEIAARAANALENARLHRQQTVLAQNLERERTFLSLAQRASNAGSWEVDLTTDPWNIKWSRNLEEIYGLEPGAFPDLHQAWMDRLHPDDRDQAIRTVENAITNHVPLQNDFRIVRPDGQVRWITARGQCSYAEDGSPRALIGINLDITERRAAEAALMRSEKLSSAGRLAATIAHEINNPLEAVTNLIFLARNSPSTQQEQFLEDADRELQRIAHITRQTLGFYRESAAPRLFALDQTVREVVSLLFGLFTRRESTPDFDLQPVTIEAVEGEIRQLLSNLISNALDASPLGGSITIRLSKSWIESSGRTHRAARISVADRGEGIPAHQLSRIFEPFFTTKKDIGTGLGLWVAREIVNKHSGRIQVCSKPGRGTVVSVLLPVSQDPLA